MPIYAPSNYAELTYWLHRLLQKDFQGPRAIRYPRGGENALLAEYPCSGAEYDFLKKESDASIVLVSYADEIADVLQASGMLSSKNVRSDVLKIVKIYPFTEKFVAELRNYKIILFAEECVAAGSIGEHLEYELQQNGWNGRFIHCAVQDACLPHATVDQIKQCVGLDAGHLVQAVRAALMKGV